MVFFALLVFVSCALAATAFYVWLTPTKTQARLEEVLPAANNGAWNETVIKVADRFARLSAPKGDWETSRLRIRFLNAGIRNHDARTFFFAAKGLLPIALAIAAFLIARALNQADNQKLLLYTLGSALVGVYLPNIVLSLMVQTRQREIFETFPDAADLMLVSVEAGLGLDASLTRVAEEISRKSPVTAEELLITNLEIRAGVSRESALRSLALRTGIEEISIFASMLTQADKFGTSITDCLRVFSDDLRHKRQVRAEEKAAKIPVKMLIPLVLCIFPALIMVIMGPVVIQVVRTILPMFGAK